GTGYCSLTAGDRGDVWTGVNGDTRMRVMRIQDRKYAPGSPDQVLMMYRDPEGVTWISSVDRFQRWKDGVFTAIPPPEPALRLRSPTASMRVSSVTKDQTGTLWVAFGGSGEFQLEDGVWTFVPVLKDHPDWTALYAYTDAADRIWLVYGPLIAVVDH